MISYLSPTFLPFGIKASRVCAHHSVLLRAQDWESEDRAELLQNLSSAGGAQAGRRFCGLRSGKQVGADRGRRSVGTVISELECWLGWLSTSLHCSSGWATVTVTTSSPPWRPWTWQARKPIPLACWGQRTGLSLPASVLRRNSNCGASCCFWNTDSNCPPPPADSMDRRLWLLHPTPRDLADPLCILHGSSMQPTCGLHGPCDYVTSSVEAAACRC